MARPVKNNADYFSHDNDMRNDDKILAVRRKFWHEWYSIWNMLLEKLCKADWFIIDVDNVSIELLSWDFMIEPDMLTSMIDYFCTIRLLTKKWKGIYSQKMIDRFGWLLSKRKRDIDYRDRKLDDNVVIDVENTQSKVKESKVNKTNNIYRSISRWKWKSNLEITIEENKKLLDEWRTQDILDRKYDDIENYTKNWSYKSLYFTTRKRLDKEVKPKPKITADDDIYSLMA